MNAAITALKCALADAEANYRKIDNPAVSQQLSEGILQYKKAIGILAGCTFCKNIADNPVWFYDHAICPECADNILAFAHRRHFNHFGMEK